MSCYVYILYSPGFDRFYVGQTHCLASRFERHNRGYETYTCKYRPWVLLWKARKKNRSDAMLLETKLKNLSRKRKIAFMKKYAEGLEGPGELFLEK